MQSGKISAYVKSDGLFFRVLNGNIVSLMYPSLRLSEFVK